MPSPTLLKFRLVRSYQTIIVLPDQGLMANGDIWEAGIEKTQQDYRFYIATWEVNDAAGVLRVMKAQARQH